MFNLEEWAMFTVKITNPKNNDTFHVLSFAATAERAELQARKLVHFPTGLPSVGPDYLVKAYPKFL